MSTEYITVEGSRMIRAEIEQLSRELSDQAEEVGRVAQFGDVGHENSEHDAASEVLNLLRLRLRELQHSISGVQTLKVPQNFDEVTFGACVTVEVVGKDIDETYRIVGPGESIFYEREYDLTGTFISYDSPLAKVLMGKQTGTVALLRHDEKTNIMLVKSIDSLLT